MANPTTNYGFVLPTPTDLVTDLPADFDIALQGVDTRLKALQPGTTLGDLAYSSATANTSTRLPIGTTGQVLAVSGGVPAWTTTADVTPLTTKGDLFTFTTVDARLAVGNNGETLVADSSATTGLRWQGDYAAGKNKIINGDFNINQRGFTSTTTTGTYGFDRFTLATVDGTCTYSAQTFTPGTAPVVGYEAANFARIVTTGQTLSSAETSLRQPIESVRTFAGQTVTFSFWAKAASGTPKVSVGVRQQFGSGGSPSAVVATYIGETTISTSWARYSVTGTVPSISGKTVGTTTSGFLALVLYVSAGSDLVSQAGSIGIQTNTFDFWGVQVEAGSVATAFQTATGTIQGELAACQRYYFRITPSGGGKRYTASGFATDTTNAAVVMIFPVPMRIEPTALEQSGTATDYSLNVAGFTHICTSVPAFTNATTTNCLITFFATALLVAGDGAAGRAVNTNAYLGWSAEL
jgi:hypothetical protein